MKKIFLFVTFLFVLTLAACSGSKAGYGSLGGAKKSVPFMEDVRHGFLPNGLEYFILQNEKPQNRAFLTLAVKAGSVNEDDDEQGLAHFVEHMAFNGTERFPEQELLEYLRSLGMRFGADINAYTSYDETVYYIETPTELQNGIKVIPEKSLAILDDFSRAILFMEKDVDEERAIIHEEERSRNSVHLRVMRELGKIIYRDSKYKDRMSIGLYDVIENSPSDKLKQFYNKWYRADNMALIFSGDFSADELEKNLASFFGAVKQDDTLIKEEYNIAPPQKNRLEIKTIVDSEYPGTAVSLMYKAEKKDERKTIADFRRELVEEIMISIINERFYEETLKSAAPFTGAYSSFETYGNNGKFFDLSASVKEESAKDTITYLITEKNRILKFGFTDDEIERAKLDLIARYENEFSEKDKTDSQELRSGILYSYLNNEYLPSVEWKLNAAQNLLPYITKKDLSAVFKNVFSINDLTLFVVSNTDDNIPADIEGILKDAQKIKITRAVKKSAIVSLPETEPSPGVIKEEIVDESGAVIFMLGNGVKVIAQHTKNKNDEIIMRSYAKGGYARSDETAEKNILASRFAGDLLESSGAGDYSSSDLQKFLAGKNLSVSRRVGAFQRGFSGFTTTGDAKTFFELLHLIWTRPRFEEDAAKSFMDLARTYIINLGNSPESFFSAEITNAIYSHDPYFVTPSLEDIEKINIADIIEDAKDFIFTTFNPRDFTFVFTGNIEMTQFKKYIETYIASITEIESVVVSSSSVEKTKYQFSATQNNINDRIVKRPAPNKVILNKGKEKNRAIVFMGIFDEASFNMKDALNTSILADYMDILLTNEIREKLGAVYSIDIEASLETIPPPGEYAMQLYFYCDPLRVDEIYSAIMSNLNSVANGIIDGAILEKAKLAAVKSREDNMQDNFFLASTYIEYDAVLKLPLNSISEYAGNVLSITEKDIQTAAKLFAEKGAYTIVMMPE